MALPKEISPNPLVTSTVEVRFNSGKETSQLLPLVYSKFLKSLPNLTESNIPKEIRANNSELAYAPAYTLSNDNYSLSFSNKIIAFENVSDYKFWNNYFPFITTHLKEFFELGIITNIERIGVRYASILDKVESIDKVLVDVPKFTLNSNYKQNFSYYRSDLIKDGCNLHLQIANNARATKNNKFLSGVYIDIDASFTGQLQIGNDIIGIIDKLHTQEKELFFSLLKQDFINTLNPKF